MLSCRDIDTRIVDWLYQELDPPAQASFREHIGACERCAAEIASFAFIRAWMSALPLEEPPLACSNIVLHEAGKRTVRTPNKRKGGLWAWFGRLVGTVSAHPALAAVASLVLIVAIGGTLYLRGVGGLSEPELMSDDRARSATPERASAPAGEPGAATTAARAPEGDGTDEIPNQHLPDQDAEGRRRADRRIADLIDADDQSQLYKAKQQHRGAAPNDALEGDALTRRKSADAKGKASKRTRSTGEADKQAEVVERSDATMTLEDSGQEWASLEIDRANALDIGALSGSATRAGAGAAIEDESQAPVSAPPPARSVAAADHPVEAARSESSGNAPTTVLDAQYRQLSRALASRRCAEAARIANDILDRDRAYFDRTVRRNKRAAVCDRQISAETRARTKRRAAESQRAPKAAKSAPAKADESTVDE